MRNTELTTGVRFVVKDVNTGHHGDVKHQVPLGASSETLYETCVAQLDWLRRKQTLGRS